MSGWPQTPRRPTCSTCSASLDEHDREVLACRFVAGLTEAETAATLGVPLGTVKSRTARALARARALAATAALEVDRG